MSPPPSLLLRLKLREWVARLLNGPWCCAEMYGFGH